ncbi:MAG: MFS transporter [bacterium]|nr:MFS transporter [bacterium]
MRFTSLIFLISILVAAGQLANTIFIPAMGMIAASLHVSAHNIQGLLAAYLLPYGISQFFYGPLADKYGRKPIIYFGLIIFMFGSFFSFVGNIYMIILIGCVMQGIGAGVGGVMCRTIMKDCYDGDKLQTANSYMTIAVVIAPLLAPIIGGVLAVLFGWRSVFLFLFIFAGIVLFLEYKFLKETNPETEKKSLKSRYLMVIKDKKFMPYVACLTLGFSGIAVFEASAGVILSGRLGFSPEIVSVLFILPIPFFVIGSYISGKIVKYYSLETIIFYSINFFLLSSVGMLVFALLGYVNVYALILPVIGVMFALGGLFPTATTGAIQNLGSVAGISGAVLGGVQNIGAGLFTGLSSLIPQSTQLPLAVILTLQGAIMIIVYIKFIALKSNEKSKKYQLA